MLTAFEKSKETYGYPRIAAVLNKEGTKASASLVYRIMKDLKIRAKVVKKPKKSSEKSKEKASQNLIKDKDITGPNQVIVSDITYIRTKEKWMYLCCIMDLYSRKIIAHTIDDNMESKLVEDALKLASKRSKFTAETIFHSDKGSQFRSKNFRTLLKELKLEQSMCGAGNCYENAAMESFHSSLKKEIIYPYKLRDKKDTQMTVFEYIEGFYNRTRLHSSLGYLSPIEYEEKYYGVI